MSADKVKQHYKKSKSWIDQNLVHQTKAGLIVPIGDAKALADAIRQLVEDKKMWAEMSARGRENAIRFRWDDIAKSYYQLYKDLVH